MTGDILKLNTESYSYDPVGNRLTGPQSTDSYTYDAGNEQLTYKGKLLLLDTGDQNEYDANGNLIKKTQTLQGKWKIITTYAYDDENRLLKVTIQRGDHIKAVSFAYDPLSNINLFRISSFKKHFLSVKRPESCDFCQ